MRSTFIWYVMLSFAVIAPPASAEKISYRGLLIESREGMVQTVNGLVKPDTLGVTITHEHLFIDLAAPFEDPAKWQTSKMRFPRNAEELEIFNKPFRIQDRGDLLPNMFGGNRDALVLDNIEDAKTEVTAFRTQGGGTIVDVTTAAGRKPSALVEVSKKTGVNIVMGTGFYRTAWHPPDMDDRSVDDITETMVREIVQGVPGTSIRAGIIGEIGAENLQMFPAESNEVKVLRASARASQLTGAAVSVHNHIGQTQKWHLALDILEQEGVDMDRVIAGHITGIDADFAETLLKRGVYLQFDTLGAPFSVFYEPIDNRPNLDTIIELVRRGYADRILVSQDVCTKFQLSKHGGFGYTFVLTNLVPFMRAKGVNEYDIWRVTVRNPADVLTLRAPRNRLSRKGA